MNMDVPNRGKRRFRKTNIRKTIVANTIATAMFTLLRERTKRLNSTSLLFQRVSFFTLMILHLPVVTADGTKNPDASANYCPKLTYKIGTVGLLKNPHSHLSDIISQLSWKY